MGTTFTEPRRIQGGEQLVAALFGALGVLLLEFLLVTLGARAQIASIWELQYGSLGLAPAWILLGAAGALAGWLLLGLVEAPSWRIRAIAAGGWGLLAGATGWGVGGGRHLAELGPRLGFALLVAGFGAATAYLGGPLVARGLRAARRSARGRGLFTIAVLAALFALEVVNQTVLVRLYPAFHGALTGLTLALAALAVAPFVGELRGCWQPWAIGGAALVVIAGAALVPGARAVRGFDNLRWILLERAPSLRWGVQLAARVAPPSAPAREDLCTDDCAEEPVAPPSASAAGASAGLDWRGRDIVLLTVDALRADRLGAYGNSRGLTPALDALAREGAVFEAAYAPTPHTSYSITSLMTGKYMRPLLLQGAGEDSDTWAGLLRTYEYRTAAFYPPAVFFIDTPRFRRFETSRLDFEYSKVEFAEGEKRLGQIREYLDQQPPDRRIFLWLHLFGPHEPYEAHEGFDYGARDIDRYDSEVAFADRTLDAVVRAVRARNPQAVILVTADHGEEFGEHGGRYHGTTVYEEQVRVPLLVVAPGSVTPRRIAEPVQTIDLLPTVLEALAVPRPARIRGRDLGPLLTGQSAPREPGTEPGLAVAETEDHTLLAEGTFRLICERRIGACQLFDLAKDPGQRKDVSTEHPERFERMRARSRHIAASHGEYETRGLRAEGRGWPAPILRGISGDADAAPELSELLDDADPAIRRKAAELLFELARPETSGSLRLSLARDEDVVVRRWAALALTRLGEGAPLVYELVADGPQPFRRLAALALAETGDARGERELIAWWAKADERDFDRSRQLLRALARIRSKDAVGPLVRSLSDVRLRPDIARTLATIGDKDARGFLVRALNQERYQSARGALVDAIVKLGGKGELVVPLVRFLGVPDPLQGGLAQAQRAGILHHVGGPKDDQLRRIRSLANSGVVAHLNVPPGGNGKGVRVLLRATTRGGETGRIYLQKGTEPPRENSKDSHLKVRYRPTIEREKALEVVIAPSEVPPPTPATLPASSALRASALPVALAPAERAVTEGAAEPGVVEVAVTLPAEWRARPGHPFALALFADQNVQLEAIALVPLADELPPPPPEPWQPK